VETPDGQILQDTTAMHYRWNDPRAKAFAIGEKVAAQMMSYLPRLGISDESGQTAVENFFAHTSEQLNQCVGPTTYAFGPHPSLIDFCLFTGYYAHHYRDHGDAADFLKSQTPDLCYYLENLHAAHCAPADIGWLDFLQQPPAYRLLHDDYQIKRGLTLS
jgi:glutathione S-transferase